MLNFRPQAATTASLAGVLIAGALLFAGHPQQTGTSQSPQADLEHGQAVYSINCRRCHGDHGDDITCSGDMTPLAGIGRRAREGLVAQFMSPSYHTRGLFLEGTDARDLTAFLLSLKGEKGFDDPGLLYVPRLLSKKYRLLKYYRVIDVRDKASYSERHIPNAAIWPSPLGNSDSGPQTFEVVEKTLHSLGIRPDMVVVVYDETLSTKSALLWWLLVQAGQANVAILDGGYRRWVDEEYPVTPDLTPLAPVETGMLELQKPLPVQAGSNCPLLHLSPELPQPSERVFDWRRTVVDGSLRTAAEIREYLGQCEIRSPGISRLEGAQAEAAFLVYLLRLLGFSEARFDPHSMLLEVPAR